MSGDVYKRQFWETYNSEEIAPYLQQLDTRIANGDNGEEKTDSVAADSTAAKKEVAKMCIRDRYY